MAFAAGKLRAPPQQGSPGLVTQKILRRAGQEANPIQLSKATKQVLAERVMGKIDARRSSEDGQALTEEEPLVDALTGAPSKSNSARSSGKTRPDTDDPTMHDSSHHRHHHRHARDDDGLLPPVAEALLRILQASPHCTVQELSSSVGQVLRKHGAKKAAQAFELSMHTAIVKSEDSLPSTTDGPLSNLTHTRQD